MQAPQAMLTGFLSADRSIEKQLAAQCVLAFTVGADM